MGTMGDRNRETEPVRGSDARVSAPPKASAPPKPGENSFQNAGNRHVARGSRCSPAILLACLVVLLIAPASVLAVASPKPRRWADIVEVKAGEASETQREEIRSFFSSLDADGDGQVRGDELGAYVASSVGGQDFDTDVEVQDAVRAVQERIDGQDTGDAIDADELIVSLTRTTNQMLRPHRVSRWVKHGLNFPQYADRFDSHGITILDFPALLADDGAALKGELGVDSALHRAKLTRALKRQLLQLGRSPGEPLDVRAAAVGEDRVIVKWRPPRYHGNPPVHAYIVQVREPGVHEWINAGDAVAHEDDDDELSLVATVHATREMAAAAAAAGMGNGRVVPMRFRVVAWGAHGGGSSEISAAVDMKPTRRKPKGSGSYGERSSKDGNVWSVRTAMGVGGGGDGAGGSSGTLLGGLYSAMGTFLIAAGIATRFALNGASLAGAKGLTFLLARARGRGPGLNAEDGTLERAGEASANGALTNEDRDSPPLVPVSRVTNTNPAGANTNLASPQPRYDRARVLESAMAAAVAAGVADADDEAILSSPAVLNNNNNGARFPNSNAASVNGSSYAASDASDDVDGASGMDAAICGLSSEPKKKGRCCVVGCKARWDRWSRMGDFRMMYQKHYCGLCQRAYCQAHTRVSPHGAKGRCDPESKCYCAVCWDTLDKSTRESLEATNKLPGRRELTSGTATPDAGKRAKTRWRSVLNYKLRTPSRAENMNLMDREDLEEN